MKSETINYYDMAVSVDEGLLIADDEASYRQANERVKIESDLAFWAVIDGVLLVFILGGNILTILAVRFSRRLRSVISNMFILSLAISDMVVGFTLPYHLAFYMGSTLGSSRGWCLLRFFLIILACCVSIWNLIAIAVDRYIAIVYPLHYSRYMTRKVALILLSFGWIVGAGFALIPMFWNNFNPQGKCEFDEVLPKWYIAGVITPGFSMVWICMLIVYWRIWREASKHAKQLRSSFTGLQESPSDWKSVQVVLLILGCFSICWLPYFIVACVQIFNLLGESSQTLYKGAFSLAMANSGMNPIIYAWKNTSFRRAFARLLRCKSPDFNDVSQHSTRSNIHRKSSSLHQADTTITSTPPPHSAVNGNFNEFSSNNTSNNSLGTRFGGSSDDECGSIGRRRSLATIGHTNPTLPPTLELPTPTTENVKPTAGVVGSMVLANGTTTTLQNGTIPGEIITKNGTVIGICDIIREKSPKSPQNGSIPTSPVSRTTISPAAAYLASINGTTPNGTSLNNGKNLIVQQVECDGNGNTQIRVVNGVNFIREPPTNNEKIFRPIFKSTTIANGFFAKFRTKSCNKDIIPNGRHSMIEQHTNGNLIVNHLTNHLKNKDII